MKKHFRILASALAAMTMVSAMAVTAFAKPINSYSHIFEDLEKNREPENHLAYREEKAYEVTDKDVVVKADDFEQIINYNGKLYERLGLGHGIIFDGAPLKTGLSSSLTIKGNQTDQYYTDFGNVDVIYGEHKHTVALTDPWFGDNNNHWKICKVCGCMALLNWHHDVDNDGICDECAQPIHYRYVTTKEAPGGKVEVSREKCMLGNRVTITVTPDEGYELDSIKAVNDNEKNSGRACFKTSNPNEFYMFVDVWDVEVQPTFVKQ